MQIVKEPCGHQTLYRLVDNLDCMLGRAITSETAEEVRLHEIYVKPEHRGKGYGSTLMQAILNGDKTKLITLCTGFTNIPFFKRHDFEVTETHDSLVFMSRKTLTPKIQ